MIVRWRRQQQQQQEIRKKHTDILPAGVVIFLLPLLFSLGTPAAETAQSPHIVLLLADDFGWAYGPERNKSSNPEVVTPNLDSLARSGITLSRFYTYKFCSPTRSSLQSGRLPVHVNVLNAAPETRNKRDPVSGYAGIPVNMTCIARKLRSAGYRAYASGKWDIGMGTQRHTPKGRGYEACLIYWHHSNVSKGCWQSRLCVFGTYQ